MSKIEYRTSMPEGGYSRGIKYRDPNHFDGRPERGASEVSCEPDFPLVFSAYKEVGIDVSVIAPGVDVAPQDGNEIAGDDGNMIDQQGEEETTVGTASPHDMTDEELAAEYGRVVGKAPRSNMKRDTMIAAIEG